MPQQLEQYFKGYFHDINKCLNYVDFYKLGKVAGEINRAKKIILVGNGGSASICSHVVVDLTKAAKIRAVNFNEASLLTCFANDYGYENWVDKALDFYADTGDLVILISSSGESENMINAAKKSKEMGINVVTFTGFSKDNSLNTLGDINFWVDSKSYNIVEMTHHIWLLAIVDYIIENKQ
jgi:D-sedoheptulose 7-phosphate isomerase